MGSRPYQRYSSYDSPASIEEIWSQYKLQIILGILLILLLIGIVVVVQMVQQHKIDTINQGVTAAPTEMDKLRTRATEATQTLARERDKYPSHYSAKLDGSMAATQQFIDHFFNPGGLLAQMNDAVAKKDWDTAEKWLNEYSNLKKNQDLGILDTILGPPTNPQDGFAHDTNAATGGLFAELSRKSMAYDLAVKAGQNVFIANAEEYINSVESGITQRSFALCGTGSMLRYDTSAITTARNTIEQAKNTEQTKVDGMVDKPAVYDQVEQAKTQADSATTSANSLEQEATTAAGQITSCQLAITNSTAFIGGQSFYLGSHQYEASQVQSEMTSATGDLILAQNACITQNFNQVSLYVSSCLSHTDSAQRIAVPTPTPEPTNTPRPAPTTDWSTLSSDDDDDDSSPSFDWDNDSSDSSPDWSSDSSDSSPDWFDNSSDSSPDWSSDSSDSSPDWFDDSSDSGDW